MLEAEKAPTRKEVSMGELREQRQHDLVVRGRAPRTQEVYLAAVRGLAKYYHQRPDTLSEEQLHAYVRHLN